MDILGVEVQLATVEELKRCDYAINQQHLLGFFHLCVIFIILIYLHLYVIRLANRHICDRPISADEIPQPTHRSDSNIL